MSIVRIHFEENQGSIRNASRKLEFSYSKVHNILKRTLKWRPYRVQRVHHITEQSMLKRKEFCSWVIQQSPGLFQKVIFSDEKWFVLQQSPNQQNDRIWAPINPNISVASKRLHGEKIMCWAGFVNGKMLKFHWFIDAKGKTVSVNEESYLKMLKEVLWPQIRYISTRKGLWFQQDGARPHTCKTVLDFLREKFHGRILSNLTDRIWPPYSPDLNPLDYFFWGYANKKVFEKQPKSINELRQVIEDTANNMDSKMLHKVVENFMKIAVTCVKYGGVTLNINLISYLWFRFIIKFTYIRKDSR